MRSLTLGRWPQNKIQDLGYVLITPSQHALHLASRVGGPLLPGLVSTLSAPASADSDDIKSTLASKVTGSLAKAVEEGDLTPSESAVIRDLASGTLYRRFGTRWESEGLDAYEEKVGTRVTQRNDANLRWEFHPDGRDDITAEDRGGLQTTTTTASKRTAREKEGESDPPLFCVCGTVDGVRDDYYLPSTLSSPDPYGPSLQVRRCVVEMKHRVSRFNPRWYDVLQLVAYMIMVGAEVGEVRVGEAGKEGIERLDQG